MSLLLLPAILLSLFLSNTTTGTLFSLGVRRKEFHEPQHPHINQQNVGAVSLATAHLIHPARFTQAATSENDHSVAFVHFCR